MFESELRAWLQQTDGPSYDTLTPEVMEAIGVDPVFEGPQATGGTVYQYSQRDGVEQISGNWYTKYILGPVFTDSTIDGVTTTAAEAEAAYKATKDAEQSASVRTSRNDKLAACDWTQLADSTADKTTWATYRQSLRDVTAQDGFPWNVTWPEAP
jgi:hypothetical protein